MSDPSFLLTLLFSAVLTAGLLTRLYLASRQIRHVARHRNAVPAAFAATISLQAHHKAADYTIAQARFGMLEAAFAAILILGWTLLGGIDALNQALIHSGLAAHGKLLPQLALLAAFGLISGLLDLPFTLYNTFKLEERFGFNKMTLRLWLADLLKSALVGIVIGLPIVALILWLMGSAGSLWWLWAWGAWMGFNLLVLVLYPTVIAPLFNKFKPLDDEALKARVQKLDAAQAAVDQMERENLEVKAQLARAQGELQAREVAHQELVQQHQALQEQLAQAERERVLDSLRLTKRYMEQFVI